MNPDLNSRLLALGLTADQAAKLATEGVKEAADLAHLSAEEIKSITECGLVIARKIAQEFAPVVAPSPAAIPGAPPPAPDAEIPEGASPSPAQVSSFASHIGVPPDMMSMFMMANMAGGSSGAMDLTGMIPIPTVVDGYSPRRRDMFLMVMGQIEARLNSPIIVINEDGSVNRDLTKTYIEGLESGFEPAENNIYFDQTGTAHEVIAVGVDAQSVYDADPIQSTKALQQNSMGTGRVMWKDVSLEARQTAFYAVQTSEIDPTNDSHLDWLRDHIKPGVSRLAFQARAPKAVGLFNSNRRTGSLPTLRVMLNRSPRRQEIMPRRRRLDDTQRRNLAGLGRPGDEE